MYNNFVKTYIMAISLYFWGFPVLILIQITTLISLVFVSYER